MAKPYKANSSDKWKEAYLPAHVPFWQQAVMMPLGFMFRVAAWLPERWLCHCADMLAFAAGRVAGYRRRIVRRNIADCFPDMTEDERRGTEREFYRNLADYFFQTVSLAHIAPQRIARHISFIGLDKLADTFRSGKDVVLYTSHLGNWEYITSMPLQMPGFEHILFAHVARPLKNRWFNKFFHRLRSRFNVSVPMRRTARAMIAWRKEKQQFIIGFLSDQKPGHNTVPLDVDFVGRRTPFIEGTEQLARKFHTAVYYTDVLSTGRNRYEVRLVHMTDDAATMSPGSLTAEYARLLTDSIRRTPAFYLWSHNRWRLPKQKK